MRPAVVRGYMAGTVAAPARPDSYAGSLKYGGGAGTDSPAASKAHEALVVGQSAQAAKEEPLSNANKTAEATEELPQERQTPREGEGR